MKPRKVETRGLVFSYGPEFNYKQFVSPLAPEWCGLYCQHLISDMQSLARRAELDEKRERINAAG